jgi:EpsI family protein
MNARILILAACFLAASAFIAKASKSEPVFIREPLPGLPLQINKWRGRDVPIDSQVLSVLGVDDYVNREYFSAAGSLGLYVGFYQTQRQGSTIHSPMNCLPGAGWNPLSRSYINVPVRFGAGESENGIQINRILIENGMNRAVVLYWYQAHGRVVASEYWGKAYAVLDAMRLNRTDGAMVRVISNVVGSGTQAETEAENQAVLLVQSIFPLLSRYLPE